MMGGYRPIGPGSGGVSAANRTALTAATTFYVSTTGSDSNPGTQSQPWATLQHAYDFLSTAIDFSGFTASVQLADGTYAGFMLNSSMVGTGFVNFVTGDISILGNAGDPSKVTLSSFVQLNKSDFTQSVTLNNLTINVSGQGTPAIDIESAGQIMAFSCVFSGIDSTQFYVRAFGPSGTFLYSALTLGGGNCQGFLSINDQCFAGTFGGAITITGTPAWGTAFVDAEMGSVIEAGGMTFTGSATGVRYKIVGNSVINTNGGGANFFPGNSAGSTSSGGQYI